MMLDYRFALLSQLPDTVANYFEFVFVCAWYLWIWALSIIWLLILVD